MNDVSMPSLMSWKTDPVVLEHTWEDVVLYALGVGTRAEQLRFLYENAPGGLQVLPSWAVVPEKRLSSALEAQLDHTRMLHGEQLVRQHRPIPPSGKLVVSSARPGERPRIKVATDGEIVSLAPPLVFRPSPQPLQLIVPPVAPGNEASGGTHEDHAGVSAEAPVNGAAAMPR